jgi:hypothetical protein
MSLNRFMGLTGYFNTPNNTSRLRAALFARPSVSTLDLVDMKLGQLSKLSRSGRRPLWAAAIVVSIIAVIWAGARLTPVPVADLPDRTPLSHGSGHRVENEYLYRVQALFHPTLDANRKEFAGLVGSVRGFGAGEVYPQVWLRDSSTIIPTSRFYYSLDYLSSWLEEHLAHQMDDGQLYDWIAAGPLSHFARYAPRAKEIYQSGPSLQISADKNTP